MPFHKKVEGEHLAFLWNVMVSNNDIVASLVGYILFICYHSHLFVILIHFFFHV